MVNLFEKGTEKLVGQISDEQLQFLIDQLEEESMEDRDYALTGMTVDYLEEMGADAGLLALLRQALGGRDEVTVEWRKA